MSEHGLNIYEPALIGFRDLFYASTDPDRKLGFTDGTSILLTGGPGSGKTTFAFACARDLLFRYRKGGILWNEENPFPPIGRLYYISLETTTTRLQQVYHEMGWFQDDPLFSNPPNTQFTAFVPDFKADRPPPTPEETLNDILSSIRTHHLRNDPGPIRIIAIIDSLNSLLRDCADRGEARRQTHEFLLRLREALGCYRQDAKGPPDAPLSSRLALAFLLSEEPESRRVQIPVSEYVTELVFRFDTSETADNKKLRTFEILKAQGANMRICRHTWAIVSANDCQQVFSQEEMRIRAEYSSLNGWPPKGVLPARHQAAAASKIQEGRKPDESLPLWGTIAIFAQTGMRAIGEADPVAGGSSPTRIFSGIPGLDAMLDLKEDYWAKASLRYPRMESRQATSLIRGTTTLIIGPAGTGKTTMSLQFLQGDVIQSIEHKNIPDPQIEHRALYVSFENRFEHIVSLYPGNQKTLLDADSKKHPDPGKRRFVLHTLHRRRGNLDPNIVLTEMRYLLNVYPSISRIAIDGLAVLLGTAHFGDYTSLVEMIVTSIKSMESPNGPRTLFLTFEAPTELEHAPPQHLSGIADNLILLRQLAIDNERRTCIEVLKARKQRHDRSAREVRVTNTANAKGDFELPLAIRPGFECFAGVLERQARPVEVYLQLFSENKAEIAMNRWLTSHLRATFGYKVHEFSFSRHAISSTLNDLTTDSRRISTSDIRILSVDEWWIRDHRLDKHPLLWMVPFEPQPIETQGVSDSDSYNSDSYNTGLATFLSDFWAPEVEKATLVDYVRTPETTVAGEGAFKSEQSQATTPTLPIDGRPSQAAPNVHGTGASTIPMVETRLMAVPCYMDFGLFAVNLKFLNKVYQLSTHAANKEPIDLDVASQNTHWNNLLTDMPRQWASPDGDWFRRATDAKKFSECAAICDTIGQRSPHSQINSPKWLFAFDMEVPETTLATFLEFCWSFGAEETFLIANTVDYAKHVRQLGDKKADLEYIKKLPMTAALRFLMYMVHEGLMSAHPKLGDVSQSLFARLFYSNYVDLTIEKNTGDDSEHSQNAEPKQKDSLHPLLIIPYFPVGLYSERNVTNHWNAAFHDMVHRIQRLNRRLLARLLSADLPAQETGGTEATLLQLIEKTEMARQGIESASADNSQDARMKRGDACKQMQEVGESLLSTSWKPEIRQALTGNPKVGTTELLTRLSQRLRTTQFPGTLDAAEEKRRVMMESTGVTSFDTRDVKEILHWHQMRITMLELELDHGRLSASALGIGSATADAEPNPNSPPPQDGVPSALTGYSCAGSWMVGLFRSTPSPGLSSKYMEEICSLESAHQRAKLGAGLPARKDFFEFYGDEPVAYAEHMTWNQLYRSLGCRARRRERAVCSYVPVSRVTRIVYDELRDCLAFSLAYRRHSTKGNGSAARATKASLIERASLAVHNMLTQTGKLMEQGATMESAQLRICVDCPNKPACEALLSPLRKG